jgi:hypothetical protein
VALLGVEEQGVCSAEQKDERINDDNNKVSAIK